jgi:tetratricopeptide (TPR) repeat protein
MIDAGRYTSGAIAIANLSASIDALDRGRAAELRFEDRVALSKLLFVRGDLLGRIADHDRAEMAAMQAVVLSPATARTVFIRANVAARFHRFGEANLLLDEALAAGHVAREIDAERAALLQATGRYSEALALRERLAQEDRGIHTLGALGSLFAEMGRWTKAEECYAEALNADEGPSPIPCAQLLFEWGVSAMRRRDLDRAEEIFSDLATVLPQHVPGRGHRAEVALERGCPDGALALINPLLAISDDPEYRATHAEILTALGDGQAARDEAMRAASVYDSLLARRPEAYADHAAWFFMSVGNRPALALDLAQANWKLRDTPRSRRLLEKALQKSREASLCT